jgi:hypothetical protein
MIAAELHRGRRRIDVEMTRWVISTMNIIASAMM